jgi:hypothetical protein
LIVAAQACKFLQAAITPATLAFSTSHQCAANAQQTKHHFTRFIMTEHALTHVLHTFFLSAKFVASVTKAALNAQEPANNVPSARLGFTCLELYAWISVLTTTTQTLIKDFVIPANFPARLAVKAPHTAPHAARPNP